MPARRYLTREQMAARGTRRLTGRLTDATVARGVSERYAAKGPWEVTRRGAKVTLYHYAFPVARAELAPMLTWVGNPASPTARITRVGGRPRFGLSSTDIEGIREFASALGTTPPEMKRGRSPDRRLTRRVSPYAIVDETRQAYREALGIDGYTVTMGSRNPARRGMLVRGLRQHAEAHASPTHHIGSCDTSCRAGFRDHTHRGSR